MRVVCALSLAARGTFFFTKTVHKKTTNDQSQNATISQESPTGLRSLRRHRQRSGSAAATAINKSTVVSTYCHGRAHP